jgi:hypothetical protein
MKYIWAKALFIGLTAFAAQASASVPPNVHIAYPYPGMTQSNYFKTSFTVTCPGGQHSVRWLFDGAVVGSATFYDNFNAQFLHKLPTGWHVVQVISTCGQDAVRFIVN